MALTINTNVASLNAQRNLSGSTIGLNKTMARLSSGLRINRSGDDAAGLAISEGLRSQIRGMNQAVRNANDGLSLIGTAESGMNTYTEMLQRIRELSIQSANDTNSAQNRQALNKEAQQLLEELGRISTQMEFNGTKLMDGSFTTKQLQVGAFAGQTIDISLGDLRTSQIGQIAQTTGTAATLAGAFAANDLTLNGVDIGGPLSNDGVSTSGADQSALAIANAINTGTGQHNVQATAQPTTVTATLGGDVDAVTLGDGTNQLTINGVDIFDVSTIISDNDSTGNLVDGINAKSNQTGVMASLNASNQLVLTAADGRNIQVVTTGSVGDELGFLAANGNVSSVTGGTVKITSNDPIIIGGNAPAKAGLTATTIAKDPNTALNTVAIDTVEGANLTIDIIDNALNQINNIRADVGAITNRLEQTIANLQNIAENLSSADSRIRDADFAAETAALSKNQILQQAGISVLAQANVSNQAALSLLQQ